MPNIALLCARLFPSAALAVSVCGCASVGPGTPGSTGIVLDGDIGEWAEDAAAACDERYLYLRFTVEGEQQSLQASPRTVVVFIDADASSATGEVRPEGPLAGMGVDFEVHLSPRGENGRPGRGVRIWSTGDDGVRTPFKPAVFDLSIAPTYASSWYEMRIARSPEGAAIPATGLASTGAAAGVIGVLGADGEVEAWADPFRVEITRHAESPRMVDEAPPGKPADGVRVVSWNIEKSGPVKNPEPFRRVLSALAPDIVLMQEWEEGDADAVKAWLEEAGMAGWGARKSPGDLAAGGGVLVASRFPIEPFGASGLTTGDNGGKPVRFVAGVVRSPIGDVLAGSTHLKCCGSKDSSEDRQRMSEARAINALVQASQGAGNIPIRVITGDLNLVGSRPPLDLLRAGLDADGSDLDIADARALGDESYVTWRDSNTDFPPGRLDFVLYSDSTAEAGSAFVFDTARLSNRVLSSLGLNREDSTASDHRPVVVDLRPQP